LLKFSTKKTCEEMKRLFFCSFVTLVFPSVETLSEDIEALLKENFLLGVYNGIESKNIISIVLFS